MNSELIGRSENKIRLLKEHLESLDDFKGELNNNIIWEWIYGVVAPISKGTADVSIEVLEKFTGKTGKTIKEGYDLAQKAVDIRQGTSVKAQILDGIEAHGIIQRDSGGLGLTNLAQSLNHYKNGNLEESVGSLLSSGEEFGFIEEGTTTVFGTLNSYRDAFQNGKDIQADSERLNGMFEKEIQRVQEQLSEEEGLLFKYSGGEKGNIQGLLNSKNNFRRLDGILMKIQEGIQRVQQNLGDYFTEADPLVSL